MSAQRAILHPFFYEKPLPKMPEQITAFKKLEYYKKKLREVMMKKVKIN